MSIRQSPLKSLLHTDRSFPSWLTLSFAWEQSMENPGEIKAAVGRNLHRLRENRKLSRRSLAKLAHTTRFELQEIEAGRVLPGIPLILRLTEALGVACINLVSPEGEAASRT